MREGMLIRRLGMSFTIFQLRGTDRQTDRDRETDRQTETERDRDKETEISLVDTADKKSLI